MICRPVAHSKKKSSCSRNYCQRNESTAYITMYEDTLHSFNLRWCATKFNQTTLSSSLLTKAISMEVIPE
uniref:Uncharacterized protein n=1 Tax=Arundo donax TaxID=35708 RepID=A0A0A9H3R0_ARUDO